MRRSIVLALAAAGLLVGGALLGEATRVLPALAAYIPCASSSALCFFELDKLNGTTIDTNSGTKSAGTQRVVLATDQPTLTNPQPASQSTGAGTNTSAWLIEAGCAGRTIANTNTTPFDNNGASTAIKLVSKVSGQKVYICFAKVGPVAGAINWAIVEGTKSSTECDTGAKGLLNGATAARGDQGTANGGYAAGNGIGVIAITPDANNDVCVLFSGTAQTGGTITWAQF